MMLLAKEAEGPHSIGQGQGLEGGDPLGTVVAALLQAGTSSVCLLCSAGTQQGHIAYCLITSDTTSHMTPVKGADYFGLP